MLTRKQQTATLLVGCLLLFCPPTARSKTLSKEQVQTKSKKSDQEHKSKRSVLDNTIAAIPPDPFDPRLNELPQGHGYPYHRHFSHALPSRSRHHVAETAPNFGLDIPSDFLSRELARPLLQHKSHRPASAFNNFAPAVRPSPHQQHRPMSPAARHMRPTQHTKQPTVFREPLSFSPSLGVEVGDRIVGESSSPLLDSSPSSAGLPQLSMGQQEGDHDHWGNFDDVEEGIPDSRSKERFDGLDPFFLSGLDLDNMSDEDASLGDAALANLFGEDMNAQGPRGMTVRKDTLDKQTDDMMAEFINFLELKESGALDKCLNKQPVKK